MNRILALLILLLAGVSASAAELYVGMRSCSITPSEKILLAGQFSRRVGAAGENPITANILALEKRSGDKQEDSAVLISIDIVSVRVDFLLPLRNAIKKEMPEFNLDKLIVSATHTHTSAVTSDSQWKIPEGIMKPSEWVAWSTDRIAKTVKEAWQARQKAKFSYGLGFASVGYNRRAVYSDGSAIMYGNTNQSNFRSVEGMEDHDINSMFFWDQNNKLLGMVVNVSCPSQEIEHEQQISSDYWGPTRKLLKEKYGKDITVLGLCGAAGDLSPHLRYMQGAYRRMDGLRQKDRINEIARRIVGGVSETYDAVINDKQEDPVFRHYSEIIELPQRIPTQKEYEYSKSEVEKRKNNVNDGQLAWNNRIISRYEDLKKNPKPVHVTNINVLRIGDAVLCTNQYELYTDFGIQIKARSKAVQTFIVQLTNGSAQYIQAGITDPNAKPWGYGSSGTYLPSKRAVEGGGYGAVIQSNVVGPEGGQILVEKTLRLIDRAYSTRPEGRKALEKLDWKLAVAAYTYRNFTFFEAIDKVAALDVDLIEGFNFQKISADIPQALDPGKMSDKEIDAVNSKLKSAGVKLIALYYHNFPADEKASRKIFERSKKLGVEYFVSEPSPELFPMLDKLANEYKIAVGLHGHSKQSSPNTWHPALVLKQCEKYSPMIGAFSDTGHWIRSLLHPEEGAAVLKNRLLGTEIHDCVPFNESAHDVPLGKGTGQMTKYLENIAKFRKGTVLFSIEYNTNPDDPSGDVAECIKFIDDTACRISKNMKK